MKIFAIEFTNHCNAKCSFCPYPTPAHTRTKGWMSRDTLERVIEIISEPKAINISGLGEPTLHKECVAYVRRLSDAGIKVQLNTNGFKLNQALYDQLHDAGLVRLIITSDYFPWRHGSIETKPSLPVNLLTISREPDFPELGQQRKPLDDWGKQVGNTNRKRVDCSFYSQDFTQICWDGTIQRCCTDFNANEPLGNIHTWKDESWKGKGISLCAKCSGYLFTSGIVAGDFEGEGKVFDNAFVDLSTDKLSCRK